MKKRWIVFPLLGLSLAGACWFALEQLPVTPRRLAPYVVQRASGHNPQIIKTGDQIAAVLLEHDRAATPMAALPRWRIGAQMDATPAAPPGHAVKVASVPDALRAINGARSGDVITFAPGRYRFERMSYVEASKAANVTVRAAQAGTVFLDFAMSEGFYVNAPHWTFENLNIQGACKEHSECEHAFHIVGGATDFVARNLTTTDFNAHYKVNGMGGKYPDQGRIEQSTLRNTSVRNTDQPVTMIDIVAASGWTVRANLITDFVKGQGDGISYGAFAKGAGEHNTFESNVVLCEHHLHGAVGTRVGLSLGGGGTGEPYCRGQHCASEQHDSVIASNLVMSCSDEGIYLNRAAGSTVEHNTLYDTAGIMLRFADSSATVSGNIVDGRISAGAGAQLTSTDNLEAGTARLYAGSHPQRALFVAPERFDFRWNVATPRRNTGAKSDLCGSARPDAAAYGAFEDFSACLKR